MAKRKQDGPDPRVEQEREQTKERSGRQPSLGAQTVRCPACGASLRYDRHAGAAVCAHCGNEFDPGALPEPESQRAAAVRDAAKVAAAGGVGPVGEAKGLSGEERFLARAPWVDHGGGALADGGGEPVPGDAPESALREVECTSCGARLVVDCTAAAVPECPYCGGAAVVQGLLSGGWEPDYIIPFSAGREQAERAFRKHVRHFLVPLGFRRNAKVAHAVGMYVPFWLYDGEVSGKMAFDFVDGNAVRRIACQAKRRFKHVPADASAKMPDEYMDAIEPYDLGDLRPYSPAYLAGYCVERRDLNAWQCAERAASRMATSTLRAAYQAMRESRSVRPGCKFMLCVPQKSDLKMSWSSVKCVLMPVWILRVDWKGESRLLTVNGQTGRLVSKLPVNERRRYGVAAATLIASLCLAVAVVAAYWLPLASVLYSLESASAPPGFHVSAGFGARYIPALFIAYVSLGTGLVVCAFKLAFDIPRLVVAWLLRRQRTAVEHTAADGWAAGELKLSERPPQLIESWNVTPFWDRRKDAKSYAESLASRGEHAVDLGKKSFAKLRRSGSLKGRGGKPDMVSITPPEPLGSFTARLARRTGMWNWRESLRNSEWRS